MAEPESLILPSKRPNPDPAIQSPKNPKNQDKLLSNFLHKAIFFAVLVAVLPFFPSQAPEFVSQSILTRTWELLHLLLVGIAISYGLFSRRNADPDVSKEALFKADSPSSYVSSILQVSSVFDDEDEADAASGFPDESKIQTWSSQYSRGEPVVVVSRGNNNGDSSGNKPLFLPVRSLKPCAQAPGLHDSCDEIDGYAASDSGSRLFLNAMGEDGRNGGSRGSDSLDSGKDDMNESVVLPSPIPWRSRSGRMVVKEESVAATGLISPTSNSKQPPVIGAESVLSKTPSFRSSIQRSASASTSPSSNRLSPSHSLSPEMRAKTSEDSGKKKSFKGPSPPLPPPPPPLPAGHGSLPISDKKDMRSFKDELKDLSTRGRNNSSMRGDDSGINPSLSETKPRAHTESSSAGRSVRTVRWKEAQSRTLDRATKTGPDESVEELDHAIHQPPPLPPRYQCEKKNELMEKVVVESDDSDSDSVGESSDVEDTSSPAVEAGPDENEVDKKADEFIAKFREQIRLQRIESIKRSTGQRSVRSSK